MEIKNWLLKMSQVNQLFFYGGEVAVFQKPTLLDLKKTTLIAIK